MTGEIFEQHCLAIPRCSGLQSFAASTSRSRWRRSSGHFVNWKARCGVFTESAERVDCKSVFERGDSSSALLTYNTKVI